MKYVYNFFIPLLLLVNIIDSNDLTINSAKAQEIYQEGINQNFIKKNKKIRKKQDFSKLAKIAENAVVNISGKLIKKGASPISINDNFDNIVYKIYNNIN